MKLRDRNTIEMSVKIDIENTLGRLTREQYLEDNPHGFKRVKKIHKNKKKYNRKRYGKDY